ncbi:hypothetical protein NDU88_011697 [Pleurodeles waltl]|uniref:Uncharacterized protein n=1 Tax=Pleurodeles waltl TaxID=8319 RepID=A0AAV7QZI5_PLEWA|nr:hypothetical protein NDU88_011697 [Pleurodeles waltl]
MTQRLLRGPTLRRSTTPGVWAPRPRPQPVLAAGEPLSGSARSPPSCYLAAARHPERSWAPRHLLLGPRLGVHSPSTILTAGGSELSAPLSQAKGWTSFLCSSLRSNKGGGINKGGPSSVAPAGPRLHQLAPTPLLTRVLGLRSTTASVPGSLHPAPSRLSLHTGFPAALPATSIELFGCGTASRRISGSVPPRDPFHSSLLDAHSPSAILVVGSHEQSAPHNRAGEQDRFCCSSLGEQQAPQTGRCRR